MVKSSEHSRYPLYQLPPSLIFKIILAVLTNQKRNFRSDALAAVRGITPPLVVRGLGYLPRGGPCLITLNHYYRPGFNALWTALAISAAIPYDVHWIMTGAFTFPGQRREVVLKPLSQQLLGALSGVYGFNRMPAMPPNPKEAQDRTLAVRQVVHYVRVTQRPVIGLAPEGRDILTGQLGDPPSGSGRFIHYLASGGMPILPVGIFEQDGAFQLQFGPAYSLEVDGGLASADLDRAVNRVVMGAIGRLLPERMRGSYG